MKKLYSILLAILLVFGAIALAELCLFLHQARKSQAILVSSANQTLQETRGAVADLRTYSAEQLARLRDSRNAKAIDAAIQTAAVFNGTGRLINKVLVPKAAKVLDSLDDSAASLNKLVQSTDQSINREITPEAVESLRSVDQLLDASSKLVQETTERTNVSLDDIHRLLSDPSWQASQREIQATLEHVDGIAAELEKSSRQMPAIAGSLERIAHTSSKYQKYVILSQILSALGRAFF